MARNKGRVRQAARQVIREDAEALDLLAPHYGPLAPKVYQSDALGQVTIPEPAPAPPVGIFEAPADQATTITRAELRAAVGAVAGAALALVDKLERRLLAASGGHLDDAVRDEIAAGRQAVSDIMGRYT